MQQKDVHLGSYKLLEALDSVQMFLQEILRTSKHAKGKFLVPLMKLWSFICFMRDGEMQKLRNPLNIWKFWD